MLVHSHVGASRGFAFVEFAQVQDAQKWMEAKQVLIQNLIQDHNVQAMIRMISKGYYESFKV